jgi:hypothetical protein
LYDSYKGIEKGFKEHIFAFTYAEVYNIGLDYDVYEFFYDESQIDTLLSVILKDLELDDLKQISLGDVPVEKPYFISETDILEKNFRFSNQDDNLMDDHVVILYQYEDPQATHLKSPGCVSFLSFFHYKYGIKLHVDFLLFILYMLIINDEGMDHSRIKFLCWLH